MPIGELVLAFEPPAPPEVCTAAKALRHRDFLTVALVVPESKGFPDNWIYVHSPDVQVGRIQNFGEWSPEMVKPGTTCLGMEYFVTEGDQMWAASDADLVDLATRELAHARVRHGGRRAARPRDPDAQGLPHLRRRVTPRTSR